MMYLHDYRLYPINMVTPSQEVEEEVEVEEVGTRLIDRETERKQDRQNEEWSMPTK